MDKGGGLGGGDLGLGGKCLSVVDRLRVLWNGLQGELRGMGGGLTGWDEEVVGVEDWNGPNSVFGDLGG